MIRRGLPGRNSRLVGFFVGLALLAGSVIGASPATATENQGSAATPSDSLANGAIYVDNGQMRPILDSIVVIEKENGAQYDVKGLPDGAVPRLESDGTVSLLVDGKLIGMMAAPSGLDQYNKHVTSSYQITGGQLKQKLVVDSTIVYPITLSPAYLRTGSSQDEEFINSYRSTLTSTVTNEFIIPEKGSEVTPSLLAIGISIPSGYVYNTNLNPKSLHDYCTASPDEWGNANFRGACARHDMCLVPLTPMLDQVKRRKGRTACDTLLWGNLTASCALAYGWAGRPACNTIARVYFAAVQARTWVWPV